MKWLSEKLETSAHRRSCGEAGLGTQHTWHSHVCHSLASWPKFWSDFLAKSKEQLENYLLIRNCSPGLRGGGYQAEAKSKGRAERVCPKSISVFLPGLCGFLYNAFKSKQDFMLFGMKQVARKLHSKQIKYEVFLKVHGQIIRLLTQYFEL
jgi:hypothetical protein